MKKFSVSYCIVKCSDNPTIVELYFPEFAARNMQEYTSSLINEIEESAKDFATLQLYEDYKNGTLNYIEKSIGEHIIELYEDDFKNVHEVTNDERREFERLLDEDNAD